MDSLSCAFGRPIRPSCKGRAAIFDATTFSLDVHGAPVEISEQGAGPTLVFLHAGYPSSGPASSGTILAELAESFRVIAPTHPGFGRADAPTWMTSVDDLAYLYLDVLGLLDVSDAVLVGASFGGWIAAEMCVMSTERVERLVLVNPLGIKAGGRESRDIVDIFGIVDRELADRAFADPDSGMRDPNELTDDELFHLARSREATARYGWSPFMHNPKLLRRLHRIDVPTLVLSGEQDQLTSDAYILAYSDAIPKAVTVSIKEAGHFPTLEQPEACAEHIVTFHTSGIGVPQQ